MRNLVKFKGWNQTTTGEHRENQIVAVFCLCDDMLKALHHHEDTQRQRTDVMAILMKFWIGSSFLQDRGDLLHILGKSRFNRRLHWVQDLYLNLFRVWGKTQKELNCQSIYAIDSYPVTLTTIIASLAHVTIMATKQGQLVEFFLTSSSIINTTRFWVKSRAICPCYQYQFPWVATWGS